MNEEEIKKSIEALVDEVFGKETAEEVVETKEEVVEKAMPTDSSEGGKTDQKAVRRESNGGEDKFKSGTPATEKQALSAEGEAKKACGDKYEEDMKKKDKDEKKMKKSIEELSEFGLDKDEIELIAAWRQENEKTEEVAEVNEEIVKAVKEDNEATLLEKIEKSFGDKVDELKKSISEKDDLIKSLGDKVEKLSNQPAREAKNIDNLEAIEKSEQEEPVVNKEQVLNKMLEMQYEGKNVGSHAISEFEATGNISNPRIKQLVLNELK